MPKPLTAAQQGALAAAGLDWDTIKSLPWAQIFALVQIIFQALVDRAPRPAQAAAGATCEEHFAHLRAINDLHRQLADCADCCLECCEAPKP